MHDDASLFDRCPGVLVVADRDGVILKSNREAERALGDRAAKGATLGGGVHPEDHREFALGWAEAAKSGGRAHATCRFQEADGAHASYVWSAAHTRDRNEVHVALVRLPDTEPRPLAKEDEPRRARVDDPALILRAILDHTNISLSVIDTEGTFVIHDGKALLESSGLRPGQFLGQSMFELYSDMPAEMEKLRECLRGKVMHWHADAHNISWECWALPIRDERGEVMGAATASFDKGDVKAAMQDLKIKLELIERQQEVIRNLETPLIQVWDQVLTLPMVGIVDSQRAARVMNDLLSMVVSKSARYAILDLTGVDTVDTATAHHLLQMVTAIRLLGAEGIISGIRPTVAQTMVTLGVDLSSITTCSNLQEALRLCIRRQTANKGGLSA